jgi:hypothetical protein
LWTTVGRQSGGNTAAVTSVTENGCFLSRMLLVEAIIAATAGDEQNKINTNQIRKSVISRIGRALQPFRERRGRAAGDSEFNQV